jgi:hypothetical protein
VPKGSRSGSSEGSPRASAASKTQTFSDPCAVIVELPPQAECGPVPDVNIRIRCQPNEGLDDGVVSAVLGDVGQRTSDLVADVFVLVGGEVYEHRDGSGFAREPQGACD